MVEQILGGLLFLAVLGAAVYFIRKRGKGKIADSFRELEDEIRDKLDK